MAKNSVLSKFVDVLTSLKLTIVCLCFAIVLIFVGTIAQVPEGLYQAQARFFKSWWVYGLTFGPDTRIPILLPGGYLLGTVLLITLIASHIRRFKFSKKKTGILLVHFGVILLLLGQLLTDMLSVESAMRLREGDSQNYSQDFAANELVIIDTTDKDHDEVVAIPESRLVPQSEIRHEKLPFTVRVKEHWPNSDLSMTPGTNFRPVNADQGIGRGAFIKPMGLETTMTNRNWPSALVELEAAGARLGTWLASTLSSARQTFTNAGRTYEIALRFTRHYKPYSISLVEFRHDKYRGTEIPMNFSSRVRVQHAATGEDREVTIRMNSPLRYAGETFYQASFDEKDPKVTILQVVRNPGWLTPYVACILVGAGLVVQFMIHLVGFATKRRAV